MAASLAVVRHQIRKTLLNINNLHENKSAKLSNAIAKNITNRDEAFSGSVEYPPVKPRFPPGRWGEMEHSYAWLWQKAIEDLLDIPDVNGRQEYIVKNEMSHINVLPYHDHPNYLDFAKFATKMAVFPWSYSDIHKTKVEPVVGVNDNDSSDNKGHSLDFDDSLLKTIKQIIIDQILIENETVERESMYRDTLFFKKRLAGLTLRSIFEVLTTNLSGRADHLRTCQYDEEVVVRAVWDRYGIERKRRHRLSPSHYKMTTVSDQRIASSCIFNGMIRSHLPLPQFHPRNSGLSIECEKPVLDYKYSCYGVTKSASQKAENILAGHVLGDPCEYGVVGFLLTNRKQQLDEQFGPKVAKECRLGRGITSTFTWLAAQAYNQGFSGFIDLTYPLTSQTVMSDGKNFSFIACQLNTLELWKPDSANDMVNLCWHTDEMPLYDCIENGQVKGFNDDVLGMLMNVFLLEPSARGYDMKPTISDKDSNLHLKCDFIPDKVEKIVEKGEEQYIV